MVIALILVISAVATAQFVLLYWRATVAVVAASPISASLREAAGLQSEIPSASDFHSVLRLHEICPDLRSSAAGIDLVRGYYLLVSAIAHLGGSKLQSWAGRELATCTRYVAARIDQRITHNRNFVQVHAS